MKFLFYHIFFNSSMRQRLPNNDSYLSPFMITPNGFLCCTSELEFLRVYRCYRSYYYFFIIIIITTCVWLTTWAAVEHGYCVELDGLEKERHWLVGQLLPHQLPIILHIASLTWNRYTLQRQSNSVRTRWPINESNICKQTHGRYNCTNTGPYDIYIIVNQSWYI